MNQNGMCLGSKNTGFIRSAITVELHIFMLTYATNISVLA